MSDNFDVNKLLKALENDDNKGLLQLNTNKIKSIKNKVLKDLFLSKEQLNKMKVQLEDYRYVDEIPDLQYGNYIRWISLKNPDNLKLTTGGNICQIKVHDNGIHIVCRNRMNALFQICMNENLIFQKFSNQERVILSAMDYLDK